MKNTSMPKQFNKVRQFFPDWLAKYILIFSFTATAIFLTISIQKRNKLLLNSSEGTAKILTSKVGRKGRTTRANYLTLLVTAGDTIFEARRKLPALSKVYVGECFKLRYSIVNPSVFEVDYKHRIKCQ